VKFFEKSQTRLHNFSSGLKIKNVKKIIAYKVLLNIGLYRS